MSIRRMAAPIGAALLACLASVPQPVLSAASLAAAAAALSQPYAISWFTIDGGGGSAAGGAHASIGTIAQSDAGQMSGGSFSLAGGFWSGGDAVTAVEDVEGDDDLHPSAPPLAFRVFPPSPNPVRGQMQLVFDLPESRIVRAELYDVSGRLVRVLADEAAPAGRNQRVWDLRDRAGDRVSAGVYFLRFDAGPHRSRQKIVVVP